MLNKKIFILLPDGIGLRNFAFSDFCEIGARKGFENVFWNNTPFPLSDLGLKEIKIHDAKVHPATDVFKNVKIQAELTVNKKKTKDKVYDTYRFPYSYSTAKSSLKSVAVQFLTRVSANKKGLCIVREKMNKYERSTKFYEQSIVTLTKEKPSLVFCTNQRISLAIAPILAAQDLKIPTATFIFSWDNLPKGTMVVETDFYFVWSKHMKNELLYYYPYIDENQIVVTGTPQFENHFQKENIIDREIFFNRNGLSNKKKYICYSGDDITTSPYDPEYLLDLICAIRVLNAKGHNLGIIFRRCPVDFSNRFDAILAENEDVITPILPKWEKVGDGWNTILPTKEDSILQLNVIAHTELVVNLGSSMVFDYAAHKKPCAYMNYNPVTDGNLSSVDKIYNYIHFRSMPKDAVVWLNSPDEIAGKIEMMLSAEAQKVVGKAQEWFEKINQQPAEEASKRIWDAIGQICKKEIC